MNNLDSQLDEQLHASAAGLNFGPGDVDRVMARARTRGRRRQRALATVAAVAVLSGAVAGAKLSQGGAGRPRTVAAGPITAVAPAGLKRGDAGLVWQRVDPHSALGYANSVTAGGALYALSTAPGLADPNANSGVPRQLYRSSDGVEWTALRGPTDVYVADLSATGGQLYAVGTGPATVGGNGAFGPLVVDSTGNGGTTWRHVQLPIDLAAIQAGTIRTSRLETIHVASSAKGVLVVAHVSGDLNVPTYLPRGVTAPNGWVVTNTGVDLLGPINNPACPPGLTTRPPGRAAPGKAGATGAVSGGSISIPEKTGPPTASPVGSTICYPANNTGSKWSPTVIAPEANHPVSRSLTWAQLGVSGDLKRAVAFEPFVFFSADGRTFRPVTLPNPPSQAAEIQIAADANSFVVAVNAATTSTDGQELLWQSADGVTWTPTPAPPTDLGGAPSAVGYRAGRLTLVSGYAATGPSMATLVGGAWSEASLTKVVDSTPAGAAIHLSSAAIGPFGLVVLATVDDNPTAGSQPSQSLLVSRDGITWSCQAIDKLVGSNVVDISNLVVTANRFIVTALLHNGQPPQPEAVLVGTAR